MQSFWELIVAPPVLPYTLWFGLNVLYWLIVVIGLLDLDFLDLDVPDEVDAADGDLTLGGEAGASILHFFHVGKVPVTILLTASSWSLWGVALLVEKTLGPLSTWIWIGLIVPNLILSLFIAKWATLPLRPLFERLRSDASDYEDLVGTGCVVKSERADSDYGQAEILREGSAPLLINVVTMNRATLLEGEEAVIVEFDRGRHLYRIASLKSEE